MKMFQGRRVVVVGGTSGLNLGIAKGFAAEGADVAVASRDPDKIEVALAQLNAISADKSHLGIQVDVRSAEQVQAMYDRIYSEWEYIDILVSGAAGNFPAPAARLSPNGFKTVVDIDLQGAFNVARLGYPLLARPGGHLIHISAPQAMLPMPLQAHVCAAKAGVDMLTKTLAMEWGKDGIRVNSIVPGPIEETEGMARLAPGEDNLAMVAKTVPLRRNGQWQDIANAALLLSSPLASYITGAVLPVDGGWSLGGVTVAMANLAAQHEQGL